jgi:hypothetical protein
MKYGRGHGTTGPQHPWLVQKRDNYGRQGDKQRGMLFELHIYTKCLRALLSLIGFKIVIRKWKDECTDRQVDLQRD